MTNSSPTTHHTLSDAVTQVPHQAGCVLQPATMASMAQKPNPCPAVGRLTPESEETAYQATELN